MEGSWSCRWTLGKGDSPPRRGYPSGPVSAATQTLPRPAVESPLEGNLTRVRSRIASAARLAGRNPEDVRLVAVTKSVAPAVAEALARLGQLELGENRVDVLAQKAEHFAAHSLKARWHMIGHLQRNKARRALEHAAAVHSVDTPRLLETLSRLCGELGRELDVFLELRAVETGERSGFAPEELPAAVELAARLPHLRLRGLMALAAPDPLARAGEVSTQTNARRTFASVRELGSRLPVDAFVGKRIEYSMGMSGDLEAAIHEGANWVRIGTALFENVAEERP